MSHTNQLKNYTALTFCLGVVFTFGATGSAHALTYSESQKLKSCQAALGHVNMGKKFSDIGIDNLLQVACQETADGYVSSQALDLIRGDDSRIDPKVREELEYNLQVFRAMPDPLAAFREWKAYTTPEVAACSNTTARQFIDGMEKRLLASTPAKCVKSIPSVNGVAKNGDPNGNFYSNQMWTTIDKANVVSIDTRPDLFKNESTFMNYCKGVFTMEDSPTKLEAKCKGLYPHFVSGEYMFELKKHNTFAVNQFRPDVFKKYYPDVPYMAGPASGLGSQCLEWGEGVSGDRYANDPAYLATQAKADQAFQAEQDKWNSALSAAVQNPEVIVTKIEDLYNHPAYAKMDAETKAAVQSYLTTALAERNKDTFPTSMETVSMNPTTGACPKESCYRFVVQRKGTSAAEIQAAKAKEFAQAMNIPERLIGGFTSAGQLLVNISDLGNDLDGVVGGDGIYNTLKQCASVSASGSVCTLTDSKYQFSYKVP